MVVFRQQTKSVFPIHYSVVERLILNIQAHYSAFAHPKRLEADAPTQRRKLAVLTVSSSYGTKFVAT